MLQFASFAGVPIRASSVPVSVAAWVDNSAIPATVSLALGADVPNADHVTGSTPSVKFTAVCRQLVPALGPSSTLLIACSSSAAVLASSARVIATAAPFQI